MFVANEVGDGTGGRDSGSPVHWQDDHENVSNPLSCHVDALILKTKDSFASRVIETVISQGAWTEWHIIQNRCSLPPVVHNTIPSSRQTPSVFPSRHEFPVVCIVTWSDIVSSVPCSGAWRPLFLRLSHGAHTNQSCSAPSVNQRRDSHPSQSLWKPQGLTRSFPWGADVSLLHKWQFIGFSLPSHALHAKLVVTSRTLP